MAAANQASRRGRRSKGAGKGGSRWLINGVLGFLCLLWLIPTVGLLVSSFRPAADILQTGWWKVLPHKDWATAEQITLPKDTDLRGPIEVLGAAYTDEQLRAGVAAGDRRLIWENRRARIVNVQTPSWTMGADFTLDNYKNVLTGKEYVITMGDGSTQTEKGTDLSRAFLNTFTVAVPSTVIPVLIASFAAYGFAWLKFPGRRTLFVVVIALLVVPIQVALIPIMKDFTGLGLNGSFLGIWIAHTGFGLPLATYFMFNYISQLPKDLFESAFMDGASNFTIFTKLVLPLSVPAIASIGIFQFLWVWNDYLVSLIFIGSQPDVQVLSMRIADMVGSRGNDWHLLTAAAFVSMLMPLAVFFGLQKYFVRGLLGGSVKG
ncbi:carbohydrate ABC transporter permease [Paenibacillus mucilaginosus]|uniref:Binding-protein-dependent transport system inner membrane component n=1 Tax=Paenibacillus mucilaginosus (strain KNP414) TaxID=1036673 RepID=F8FC84_PAEMK|nr:carbohydrate ABC transporter permease [Paenibacillus mucilaginosus]AEI44485.1 binding-protein-dependent transport system inner membrane component [Paenibacillus mucilaginosus KNP414]MCG7217514.1 carbohydrate ABC transporter permease [Paenibacillus mucilaginosus]WDM30911.1 carbohydrate ABC transporter permease [Paenibacillus mucilaginosus]